MMRAHQSWPTDHKPNSSSSSSNHHQNKIFPKIRDNKHGFLLPAGILVFLLLNLTGLVLFLTIVKEQKVFHGFSEVADVSTSHAKSQKVSEDESLLAKEEPKLNKRQIVTVDKLLGDLLHGGFDERSCLSRYESVQYLGELKRRPSSYLISKLRRYEAHHRRCGPHTASYNKTLNLIQSGGQLSPTDCKYFIWIPYSGWGNRILTITSAFLYAILENRVVLIDPYDHIPDLFCEPFPGTSWLLPEDFPVIPHFHEFNQSSPYSHGYMVKNNLTEKFSESGEIPPFVYLNLIYDMDRYDESFYKDEGQMFLRNVPWITMMSDEYFVPSLFLMPSFKKDLENMFPDKDSVFHILGRYLFHPTNLVWGLITRYHQAYLAEADEKIGIQVRVFFNNPGPYQHVLDQIVACTMNEKILPQVNQDDNRERSEKNKTKTTTKAVLVTSLSSGYADAIREMYLLHSTVTREVIQVHQPSHEEYQKMRDENHYAKALAEMYLLGMCDVLVTSGSSTFGYVAQGLGGLNSWVMFEPKNFAAPDPPCRRVMSMEPCLHLPPVDVNRELVPYIRPCEDRIKGLKLYPDTDE